MNNCKYILDDENNPIPEPDFDKYTAWWVANERRKRVGRDEVGDVYISTVFLGIDHAHAGDRPILFETMVFGLSGEDSYCERCSTWDEAVAMHQRLVEMVKARLGWTPSIPTIVKERKKPEPKVDPAQDIPTWGFFA